MKYAVLPLGALLLLGIAWLTVENRQLRQQVDSSMSYQSQLQQLSEKSALQRLQFEDEIADLNRQLTSAAQQLSSLSTTLQEARLQVRPRLCSTAAAGKRRSRRAVETEPTPFRRNALRHVCQPCQCLGTG